MYQGIRYRGIGGTTRTQALRAQEKKRSDVINEDHGLVVKAKNSRIELFATTYLQRRNHLRSHIRENLSVRTLLKTFKGKRLMSISPSEIEDYIGNRMLQGVANATINRELACLKRMYNLAIKWGDARRNPVVDVDFLEEPPGRTRFLSKEEAQELIRCAAVHLRPILITALNTGMRRMEILKLTWNRVHIDNVIEPYVEIVETKNNKERFIVLNDDMLKLFRSLTGNGSEFVFLGARRVPLKSIRKPFATALRKAEIRDFKFHDLRHTFASHYIMNGGDLMSLKEILGHSSLRMVQRYSHLSTAYKRKMINNLNGIFSNCHLFATSEKIPPIPPKRKTS